MQHVSEVTKKNHFYNRDFNFDPNNRDYDFFHNRAALVCEMYSTTYTYILLKKSIFVF